MLNPFFYPYMEGTEKVILHIGKLLAKKHKVTVLAASHRGALPEEKIDDIEVIRSPARPGFKPSSAAAACAGIREILEGYREAQREFGYNPRT